MILFQRKNLQSSDLQKDQMFSHTPVVYVNEDVWGYFTTKPKDYSAIALNTDKEIKNAHVLIKRSTAKYSRI